MKQARTLRQWALIVTGIGAGIVLAMFLLIEITNRFNYSGVLFLPSIIFLGGCALVVGGLVTILVDGVLRLTGRRF